MQNLALTGGTMSGREQSMSQTRFAQRSPILNIATNGKRIRSVQDGDGANKQ